MSEHAEQPMPKDGQQTVMPVLKTAFEQMSDDRWEIGIERYGKSLATWNGRDCGRDAMEELFDAMMYVQQGIMERRDIARKLELAIYRLRVIKEKLGAPKQT